MQEYNKPYLAIRYENLAQDVKGRLQGAQRVEMESTWRVDLKGRLQKGSTRGRNRNRDRVTVNPKGRNRNYPPGFRIRTLGEISANK